MVVVALSLAWCCRLRRVWRWGCGSCGSCGGLGGCGGAPPASEADSAGSCYYPPQYSRCGSLCRVAAQPAPPPYNEVKQSSLDDFNNLIPTMMINLILFLYSYRWRQSQTSIQWWYTSEPTKVMEIWWCNISKIT